MTNSYYQYRVSVDGTVGAIIDQLPPHWGRIAEAAEERGVPAILERRLVTDVSILPSLTCARGWIILGQTVISPWDVLASVIRE